MAMKFGKSWLVLAAGVSLGALTAAPAMAVPVYGTSASLTGSRSVAASTVAESGDKFDTLVVSWTITQNGSNWDYVYTFSGVDDGPSHFNLDLTDDCVGTGGGAAPGTACVTDYQGTLEFKELTDVGSIVGVKFDDEQLVYSFTSDRAPVWGDFAAKKGRDSLAWNPGLFDKASEDVLDFIARPNGATPPPPPSVPEPATLALFGAGLASLGLLRRRRSA